MKVRKSGAFVDLSPASGGVVAGGAGSIPAPTVVGTSHGGNSGFVSNVDVAKPAGVAVGDLILLFAPSENSVMTPPSGFTQVGRTAYINGRYGFVFAKIADGTEPATLTVTVPGNLNAGTLVCVVYRGTGMPTWVGETNDSDGGLVSAPAASLTDGQSAVGFFWTTYSVATPWTAGSGFAVRDSFDYSATGQVHILIEDKLRAGGGSTTDTPAATAAAGVNAAGAVTLILPQGAPGDHTLALSDAGQTVEMAATAAKTLTVPPNSSVAFPVGTRIRVRRTGTGNITIVAGAGVTITPSSPVITTRWDEVVLEKRATDTWDARLIPADPATQAELDAVITSLAGKGPDPRLFYESGAGSLLNLTGAAADIGGVWGGPFSTNSTLRRNGSGRISGSNGAGGAVSNVLPTARGDDFYYHAKFWRSTGNPQSLIFRYQDANNYHYLSVDPSGNLSYFARAGGSNNLNFTIPWAWVDGDDIGVIMFKGTGQKRDLAIVVNGVIIALVYTDIQNSSSGFAISVGSDWGQAFDDITVEPVPAALQAKYEATRIDQVTYTADRTLDVTDIGKVVEMDKATAVNVTIPADSTTFNPPIGTVIELWQKGAGQVTVVPAGGVTLESPGDLRKLYGPKSGGSIRKRAANYWVLQGDLA